MITIKYTTDGKPKGLSAKQWEKMKDGDFERGLKYQIRQIAREMARKRVKAVQDVRTN